MLIIPSLNNQIMQWKSWSWSSSAPLTVQGIKKRFMTFITTIQLITAFYRPRHTWNVYKKLSRITVVQSLIDPKLILKLLSHMLQCKTLSFVCKPFSLHLFLSYLHNLHSSNSSCAITKSWFIVFRKKKFPRLLGW